MRQLTQRELIAIQTDVTRRDTTRAMRPGKVQPIYRGEKREHMVSKIMDIMRDWRSSPFEHEGSYHHGLRSGALPAGPRVACC